MVPRKGLVTLLGGLFRSLLCILSNVVQPLHCLVDRVLAARNALGKGRH